MALPHVFRAVRAIPTHMGRFPSHCKRLRRLWRKPRATERLEFVIRRNLAELGAIPACGELFPQHRYGNTCIEQSPRAWGGVHL